MASAYSLKKLFGIQDKIIPKLKCVRFRYQKVLCDYLEFQKIPSSPSRQSNEFLGTDFHRPVVSKSAVEDSAQKVSKPHLLVGNIGFSNSLAQLPHILDGLRYRFLNRFEGDIVIVHSFPQRNSVAPFFVQRAPAARGPLVHRAAADAPEAACALVAGQSDSEFAVVIGAAAWVGSWVRQVTALRI